jgi:RNA polymerase sigma-70 factor (ECF subfamily)
VLHDPYAADEVFQEFAVGLLVGNLRGADPDRGRFRDFVKGTIFHLVSKYRKRLGRWPASLPTDVPAVNQDERYFDDEFLISWRDELLGRTWAALEDWEREKGQPFFSVLRFRAEHPDMRSSQIAEDLSVNLGQKLTATAIRQILHRARARFSELLLIEVGRSLMDPTPANVERELIELSLLEFCRNPSDRS